MPPAAAAVPVPVRVEITVSDDDACGSPARLRLLAPSAAPDPDPSPEQSHETTPAPPPAGPGAVDAAGSLVLLAAQEAQGGEPGGSGNGGDGCLPQPQDAENREPNTPVLLGASPIKPPVRPLGVSGVMSSGVGRALCCLLHALHSTSALSCLTAGHIACICLLRHSHNVLHLCAFSDCLSERLCNS